MTVAMPIDQEFERRVIESVERQGDGFGVTYADGWGMFYPDNGITPEKGDVVRCYGRGLGYVVRGLAIEGKGIVRYETESEQRIRQEQEKREAEEKRQREFEDQRAARDLRTRELPRALRLRMEGFQPWPNFRRDHETYELFMCEEAGKIAQHFEGENAVYRLNEWAALGWEAQKKALPAVSDDHSGYTFGAAVALARLVLLGNEEHVIRQHAAICPIVGCERAGCWSAREKSEKPHDD